MPTLSKHHIRRFEVAKDDRRLAIVQIVQDRAELYADIQYLLHWQFAASFVKRIFQRLALDEIHHQIPSTGITELFIDAWQIGMRQTRQQQRLAFECFSSLSKLLRAEIALAHLLNRQQTIAKLHIRRFVDRAKTTLAHHRQHAIPPLDNMLLRQQSRQSPASCTRYPCSGGLQLLATGGAKRRLWPIGRAAKITKNAC